MSRRYGQVWRTLWRDQRFKACTDSARLVYLALLSGPCSTALPGLVEADALILASVVNKAPSVVEEALAELVRLKLIEQDADNSMIAVVDEPATDDPVKSYKVLQGWYSNWQQLPESTLKRAHVARLLAACDLNVPGKPATDKYGAIPSMREVWGQTFGSAKPPATVPAQGVSDTPADTLSQGVSIPVSGSVPATGSGAVISIAPAAAVAPLSLAADLGVGGGEETDLAAHLAAVYEAYPRKRGKSKGLAKLAKQVKTPADLAALRRAVDNYAEQVKLDGTDEQFVKYFDTFAGEWRDFVDLLPVATKRNGANGKGRDISKSSVRHVKSMWPGGQP